METTRWWGGRLLEMPSSECWELLVATRVGRVAWSERGGPVVVPVNYTVHDGALWIRTRASSALARHANHAAVAVQVDETDEFTRSGWSVLVRGHAELVSYGVGPSVWADPSPWPEGTRPVLLRVLPTEVTGRRLLPS